MWGLEIFGGEVAGALGCKVFVLRIILPPPTETKSLHIHNTTACFKQNTPLPEDREGNSTSWVLLMLRDLTKDRLPLVTSKQWCLWPRLFPTLVGTASAFWSSARHRSVRPQPLRFTSNRFHHVCHPFWFGYETFLFWLAPKIIHPQLCAQDLDPSIDAYSHLQWCTRVYRAVVESRFLVFISFTVISCQFLFQFQTSWLCFPY